LCPKSVEHFQNMSDSMRAVMGRAGFALLFIPLAVTVVVGQTRVGRPRALPPLRSIIVSTDRVERLERWVKAVDEHEPGDIGDAASEIGRFSENALRDLWVDAQSLVALMRDRNTAVFEASGGTPPVRTRIIYKPADLRRMKVLACAAAGVLDDRDCVAIDAKAASEGQAPHLAVHAATSRKAGDEDNYILRRAALLHADVAMLVSSAAAEPSSGQTAVATLGPRLMRVTTSDGIGRDVQHVGLHWEIGRKLLDAVRTPREATPHPERDRMVSDWYRATSAWMILNEDHNTKHLDRAREIFPKDRDILFLSGCQHEAYARPMIQSAVQTAVLPAGFSIDVESAGTELRRAESFFRAALSQDPAHAEARLRLGRVLGQLDRHADAASELRVSIESLADAQQRYYGHLFLGAEEEALGRFEAARAAYGRARQAYSRAQSPYLALSELARRTGDRAGAVRATQEMFDLSKDPARDDPWWSYFLVGARNAEDWLDELRRPFKRARH
jgi:tetratricopeptide (TPR) repeat protein